MAKKTSQKRTIGKGISKVIFWQLIESTSLIGKIYSCLPKFQLKKIKFFKRNENLKIELLYAP